MDRILIDNLLVMAVIGALPHEREAAQPIRLDLDIGLDLRDACASDELGHTVDYGLVSEQVARLCASSEFVLLERLADAVARLVLGFARVEEVDVLVAKLRPPIPTPVDSTAVRIVRTSADSTGVSAAKHEVIVALGSNLGDRESYLRMAIAGLDRVVAMSQIYETEPIGGPGEQGAFLNMVVKVESALDPYSFIRRCKRIEAAAARQRLVHWGPRTLDVDVLFFDDARIDSVELVVPHPRINERRFVLAPLSEIAPERCPDGWETSLPPADVMPCGPLAI